MHLVHDSANECENAKTQSMLQVGFERYTPWTTSCDHNAVFYSNYINFMIFKLFDSMCTQYTSAHLQSQL